MKKTIKSYSARLLAILLVLTMLIPSAVMTTSASATSSLGGTTAASSTPAAGLTYEEVTFYKSGGQTAYVMQFNPETSGLMPMGYQKSAGWGVTVANSVADAQANGYTVYGGINGEFFSMASGNAGTLTGRLISNGRIISDHEFCDEYCIAIDKDGKLFLVKSEISYHFYIEGKELGSAVIARVNKRYNGNWGYDPLCYFDSSCGTKTDTIADYPGVEVVFNKTNDTELTVEGILQGEVVSVNTDTYGTSFSENQFVLYAYQNSAYADDLAALTAGQKVQIYAQEINDDAKDAMTNAITVSSATYPIVLNGQDNTDNTPNASDIYSTRAQRTAIGVKADGTYVYFCSAGRGSSSANTLGVTLPELAEIMIDLGCETAINLDGGGSSTMWVNGSGTVLGGSRAVASSILIVGRDGQAASSTAKQKLNDWIYNANTSTYPAEQQVIVNAAVAEATAVYNDSNAMTGDFVREMMDLQRAMGVVTDVTPKDYISLNAEDWTCDPTMQAANDANGALMLNNTDSKWPFAVYGCDMSVPLDYVFEYDMTVAGGASILLNKSDSTKFNMAIAPNNLSDVADIAGHGKTFKGSMKVSELVDSLVAYSNSSYCTTGAVTKADLLDADGNLSINSISICATGSAGNGSKITIRTFTFIAPYSNGDINDSGSVNAADTRLLLRHLNGYETLSALQQAGADLDKSGTLDSTDVQLMMKKSVGLA